MKVLIVDDSTAMRMIVKRSLKSAGFDGITIVEAPDGAQGYAAFKKEEPDVVLSDWNMPEMTGIEFLKKVREDGSDVKFGFVTTESTAPMRKQAEEAGVDFMIAKPFTDESFQSALKPILG